MNFVNVFCDASTDTVMIEKECVYILFDNPQKFAPQISFLSLKDNPSEDLHSIKLAFLQAFHDNDIPELKDKLVFLVSDGTSVNSIVKAGLASYKIMGGLEWLVFVWCLSHCLEL